MSARVIRDIHSTLLGDTAFAAVRVTGMSARDKGYRIAVREAKTVNCHPGCMLEAEKMKVKLIFEAGRCVLPGGQVSGAKSGG